MKKRKENFVEDIVESVRRDYLERLRLRKPFEARWRLNYDFYLGRQDVGINVLSEIERESKGFSWQEDGIYNHIAPIIDTRLAKLSALKPKMNVLPVSSSENDEKLASLAQDILYSCYERLGLSEVISKATNLSEIMGTSFYKVIWNGNRGRKVNDGLFEGDIEIDAVSPFEIFVDDFTNEDINDCESIIHAKAYSTKAIKNIWGVDVAPEDVSLFGGENLGASKAMVIEKYESPSIEHPNGRLIIVCGDKLLHIGELPYINLSGQKRGFPFIKQVAIRVPGSFYGISIIEKLIPIQRAYNGVKNRKHEYMNRLSLGVLTVEDGSIDIGDLEQNGLEPGKIVVFRQGAEKPEFLKEETLPDAFEKEEESLLNEFSEISGVTNLLSNKFNSTNMSGVALELLVEQDTSRINTTTEEINGAVKEMSRMILRLYKQFAVLPRLISKSDGDTKSLVYFKNSDIVTDDLVFVFDNSLYESLSVKREHILQLIDSGLLKNDDGQIDKDMKRKILELFGIGYIS